MKHPAYYLMVLLLGICAVAQTGCGTPLVTRQTEQTLELTSDGIERLKISATNGQIVVHGEEPGMPIYVLARIKVAAYSAEAAEACLTTARLQHVFSGDDDATLEVTTTWDQKPPGLGTSAEVSYEVHLPRDIQLAARTTNGRLQVEGLASDCELQTTNGSIDALTDGPALSAQTTNGRISINSAASTLNLRATNGSIRANLERAGTVSGEVRSTNGSIEVTLPPEQQVHVLARTNNGRIRADLPKIEGEQDTYGTNDAESELSLRSNNGSLRIRQSPARQE